MRQDLVEIDWINVQNEMEMHGVLATALPWLVRQQRRRALGCDYRLGRHAAHTSVSRLARLLSQAARTGARLGKHARRDGREISNVGRDSRVRLAVRDVWFQASNRAGRVSALGRHLPPILLPTDRIRLLVATSESVSPTGLPYEVRALRLSNRFHQFTCLLGPLGCRLAAITLSTKALRS
jgi:hypothetical protein